MDQSLGDVFRGFVHQRVASSTFLPEHDAGERDTYLLIDWLNGVLRRF